MTNRPKLLFLCQTLPYPLDGGCWIRTYHVLRLLSEAFDVTALYFERMGLSAREDAVQLEKNLHELARFGKAQAFPVPQTRSRVRLLWDHLRSVLFRKVYTRYVFDSNAFRAELGELLRTESFDLVHMDSLDLSAYLPMCEDLPVACVHHNVESELLRRRAPVQGRAPARAYFRYQAGLMKREEQDWIGRIALNVVVSEDDRDTLASFVPEARLTIVPNGVDVEEFRPEPPQGDGLAYIGGTNWFPNLDALDYFCESILPHLRAAGLEMPVHWVGSATEEEQRRYADQFGVQLTGYVDDVRPFMRDTLCNIVPLRAGGGTRLKILNSWAMGKAIVSTSVGCEGLEAHDDENMLIRDDPREFAEAISSLQSDDSLRLKLEQGARKTAEEHYSWDVIGPAMVASYRDLLPDRDSESR
jgi:glycosyltransferase involved in cell wall biosynthesis